MTREALGRCQAVLPEWRGIDVDGFTFAAPKGFSSLTMGIEAKRAVDPPAVLYRHLAGKENAILDHASERAVFELLAERGIAARCYHYDDVCRIEEFYAGRTLTADELYDPGIQRRIADELYRLHQLEPAELPELTFFELLHRQWGDMARTVLVDRRSELPVEEQELCDELTAIYADETLEKVMACLPDREPTFCHNDTYHGNIMRLDTGELRLLDFEFSCRNHIAFDFANLFAETVMRHGAPDPPHFWIAEPQYSVSDIASLVGFYLDNATFATASARSAALRTLVAETEQMIPLSDYMYAMAALPLALQPIQRIRFVPYAHQRFARFLAAFERRHGSANQSM